MKPENCAKCGQPIGAVRVSMRVTIDELDGDGSSQESLKKRTDYDSYGCAVLGNGGVSRSSLLALADAFERQIIEGAPMSGETAWESAAGQVRQIMAGGPVEETPPEPDADPEIPL